MSPRFFALAFLLTVSFQYAEPGESGEHYVQYNMIKPAPCMKLTYETDDGIIKGVMAYGRCGKKNYTFYMKETEKDKYEAVTKDGKPSEQQIKFKRLGSAARLIIFTKPGGPVFLGACYTDKENMSDEEKKAFKEIKCDRWVKIDHSTC